MIELCKGKPSDLDELKDFINLAFNLVPPIEVLAPKSYKKNADCEKYHYLIKENGRIRGALCALPVSFSVCDYELHALGIGGVSVHRDDRGKGYMQMLVKAALDEAYREKWADFSMLGGHRQRYAYFGYESGGMQMNANLTKWNMKHAFADVNTQNLSLQEISPQNTEWISRAASLYRTEPIHALRPEDRFHDILISWASKAYAVLDCGEMIGYVVLKGTVMTECVLADYSRMEEVMYAVVKAFAPDGLSIQDSVTVPGRLRFYEKACDGYSIGYNKRYLMFRYAPMVQAYLTLKASIRMLPEGCLTLEIAGKEKFSITLQNGVVSCEQSNAPADLVIPEMQAVSYLFSPMRSVYGYDIQSHPLADAWFPLPLYCPRQDVN